MAGVMPPKQRKVLAATRKGKHEEAGSTDSVFNSSAEESVVLTCKTGEEKRLSTGRERVQSKLSFEKKNMDTIAEKIDALHQLISDTKTSLERKLDEKTDVLTNAMYELQRENESLKKMLEESKKQMYDLKEENDGLKKAVQELKEKSNDLEQYSRMESVRIHGIQDDRRGESSEECERKVMDMFHSKLGLENIDGSKISAIHRVGKYMETGRPRSVIVKFISRKDKVQVIKERRKLKGTRIVITDDLTALNMQRLNRVKQHEAVTEAWTAAGGRIFAKLKDRSVKEIVQGDTSNLK